MRKNRLKELRNQLMQPPERVERVTNSYPACAICGNVLEEEEEVEICLHCMTVYGEDRMYDMA